MYLTFNFSYFQLDYCKLFHIVLQKDKIQFYDFVFISLLQLLLFSPDWFKTRLSNGHTVMASPERRASESGDSIREMGVSSNGSINSKSHVFQEYNFIKPTFCDDCKGMLKGETLVVHQSIDRQCTSYFAKIALDKIMSHK